MPSHGVITTRLRCTLCFFFSCWIGYSFSQKKETIVQHEPVSSQRLDACLGYGVLGPAPVHFAYLSVS